MAWSGHVSHLNFGGHQATNHISRTAEASVVKFCIRVGYVKSQHMDDKSPFKGAWSGLRDGPTLNFDAPNDMERLKLELSNFTRRLTVLNQTCVFHIRYTCLRTCPVYSYVILQYFSLFVHSYIATILLIVFYFTSVN